MTDAIAFVFAFVLAYVWGVIRARAAKTPIDGSGIGDAATGIFVEIQVLGAILGAAGWLIFFITGIVHNLISR